jgi:phage regulator Rha-like protein
MIAIPAHDLRIYTQQTQVHVNSRDVAAVFKKRHDRVFRDIDHLLTSPKFAGVVGVLTDYIG